LVYNKYDLARWIKKVEEQLDNSGLPHVIDKLTREMVDSARKNALTSETAEAIHLVRELRKKEGYVIIYRSSRN
jgi:predicted ArsR family transcriptional regulator